MTQENHGTSSAVPDNLPAKRKRGRPRKDRSQTPGHVSAATPTTTTTPDTEMKNRRRRIDIDPAVTDTKIDMVGQAVFGVLDGSFDAGYLLTVRVGDTDTILKGVVFQPGSSVPISGSNDVAPQIKMLKRVAAEIQVDPPTTHVQTSKEVVPPQPSASQPQITTVVQNDNFVTEAQEDDKIENSAEVEKSQPNLVTIGYVDTPVHLPESELKNTDTATDGETIKQETKGPSLAGTEPSTEGILNNGEHGFCTINDTTTAEPTTELMQENHTSRTDEVGEMLRHEEATPMETTTHD